MKIQDIPQDVLEAARERLGLEYDNTTKDYAIEHQTKAQLVRNYFAWHLGDASWGDTAIRIIKNVYKVRLND